MGLIPLPKTAYAEVVSGFADVLQQKPLLRIFEVPAELTMALATAELYVSPLIIGVLIIGRGSL